MNIPVESIRKGDRTKLAGEWLTIAEYRYIKYRETIDQYIQVWFTDATSTILHRDRELEVSR